MPKKVDSFIMESRHTFTVKLKNGRKINCCINHYEDKDTHEERYNSNKLKFSNINLFGGESVDDWYLRNYPNGMSIDSKKAEDL